MGIDPGTRRVGVAVADDEIGIASARATIEHRSDAATAQEIARVARAEEVGEIVVGLPIGMDGREGSSAKKARALAAAIAGACGPSIAVTMLDERLTSAQAHRALAASGRSSRDRRGKVDAVAAVLLLETHLARRHRRAEAEAEAEAEPPPPPPDPDDAPP